MEGWGKQERSVVYIVCLAYGAACIVHYDTIQYDAIRYDDGDQDLLEGSLVSLLISFWSASRQVDVQSKSRDSNK